jgi:hypothetical protein
MGLLPLGVLGHWVKDVGEKTGCCRTNVSLAFSLSVLPSPFVKERERILPEIMPVNL